MLKKGFFLIAVCLAIFGCSGRKANHNQSKQAEVSATNVPDTLTQPKIVTATIANKDGAVLLLKFNNATGTCEIEVDGEKAELKQQRMASGIKYSNDHFLYTEWHGEIRLYKDGKLVFSHDR